ncbi:MAG: Do family serine endopeptidase [Pseudomonadota bacterium]|nr:Do family serine endopeptidase [Pseudomonadota bacterium]
MRAQQQLISICAIAISGLVTQSAHATIDFSSLVEQASPAVVRVNVAKKMTQEELMQQQLPEIFRRFFGNQVQIPQPRRAPVEQSAYGTAFFVTQDGYLLTNHHVIDGARKVTITLNDRRELDAEIVGSDERTDVAVLRVKGNTYPALKIGNSEQVKVGEPVLAIGSPFGFDYSASAGIVSATSRTMSRENAVPFVQSDVALNPGNSGGPLFNQRGEVIGINSRIFSGTGGYMGLSFSIPVDVAMDVFEQIKQNGKVTRSYLGVVPQDIDRNLAEVYKLSRPEGALITQVMSDTPASRAGLKEGDIILSYDGHRISRSTDLINLINRTRPDTVVRMTIQRAGKQMQLQATLNVAPDDTPATDGATSNTSGTPSLGLRVRELTAPEKAQLPTSGVVIDALQPDGLAARSRLAAGDVITRLNDQPTPNLESFAKVLRTLPNNRVVGVSLLRNGMPLILGLRIESQE